MSKIYFIFILFMPSLCIGVESVPTQRLPKIEIAKVRLDNKSFNPSNGESISLEFEVTRVADITVMIYDQIGEEVMHFKIPSADPGLQKITWDGRNQKNAIAPGNVFLYVIQAVSINGEKVFYNPAEQTGGYAVKSLKFDFDKATGNIEYVLPKTCMVRIRAGLKNGMLVKTILDWAPQFAGRHTVIWDGKDESGYLDLVNHADMNINLTCYTLPANTILINSNSISLPQKQPLAKDNLWATQNKFLHYQHDARNCHEPKFAISFPNSHLKKNTPVVAGKTPIKIELDKRDALYTISKRFEVVIYVDGVFLFEMEEGSSPFTYLWDTENFTKGYHVVTVNMMSYDDHIGTVSRRIIIGDK